MLLAADVGNTEIVLGVFDGSELAQTWRLSTQPERTADELALILAGFLEQRGMTFDSRGHRPRASPASCPTSPPRSARWRLATSRSRRVIVGPGIKTGVLGPHRQPARGRRRPGREHARGLHALRRSCDRRRLRHRRRTSTSSPSTGEFLGGVIAPGMQVARCEPLLARPPGSPASSSTAPPIGGRQEHRRGDPVRVWSSAPRARSTRSSTRIRAELRRRDHDRDRWARAGGDPALPRRSTTTSRGSRSRASGSSSRRTWSRPMSDD